MKKVSVAMVVAGGMLFVGVPVSGAVAASDTGVSASSVSQRALPSQCKKIKKKRNNAKSAKKRAKLTKKLNNCKAIYGGGFSGMLLPTAPALPSVGGGS